MKYIILLFSLLAGFNSSTIYSFVVNDIEGSNINFNEFRGKKILIVNMASESEFVGQANELEQLHQLHGDSLIIVGVPSNSFSAEPRSDTAISVFYKTDYHVNFYITKPLQVSGTSIHPLFLWLTKQSNNGVADIPVVSDFQKYLIDSTGQLIGVFKGSVSPLDPQLISAL